LCNALRNVTAKRAALAHAAIVLLHAGRPLVTSRISGAHRVRTPQGCDSLLLRIAPADPDSCGGRCAPDIHPQRSSLHRFQAKNKAPESEPRQGFFRYLELLSCINRLNGNRAAPATVQPSNGSFDRLTLTFFKKELDSYTAFRTAGLSNKSINWLRKAAALLWKHTHGTVSKASIESLHSFV
jgi:hypothetical protein